MISRMNCLTIVCYYYLLECYAKSDGNSEMKVIIDYLLSREFEIFFNSDSYFGFDYIDVAFRSLKKS